MYYIGIYTMCGRVQVTTVYSTQESFYRDLYPTTQILKVCEAPTKAELNLLVKKALQDYQPLPGLTP